MQHRALRKAKVRAAACVTPGACRASCTAPGSRREAIELDHKDLALKLKQEAFHASILSLNLGSQKQQVLLRDYQMHPWRLQVLHVDFQRVAKDQKIHMKVPLHFVNAEIAPGVKVGGGSVNHVLTELDIICLPDDLPEYIEVDLSNLQMGHSIRLSELTLPKGVESSQLRGGDDAVVVTIPVPRAEAPVEEEVGGRAGGGRAGRDGEEGQSRRKRRRKARRSEKK